MGVIHKIEDKIIEERPVKFKSFRLNTTTGKFDLIDQCENKYDIFEYKHCQSATAYIDLTPLKKNIRFKLKVWHAIAINVVLIIILILTFLSK